MNLGSIIRKSSKLFRDNYQLALPSIVATFVSAFLSIPAIRNPGEPVVMSLSVFFGLVVNFYAYGVTLGMAREAVEKGTTTLSTGAFAARRFFMSFFGASLLVGAAMVFGVFLIINSALFLLPYLAAAYFFMFLMPAIVMEGESTFGGLIRSYTVVRQNMKDSFSVFAAFMASSLAVFTVSLVLNPVPVIGQLTGIVLSGCYVGVVSLVMIMSYKELAGGEPKRA